MTPEERREAQVSALALRIGGDPFAGTEGIAGWFDEDDPPYGEVDLKGMALWGYGSLMAYFDAHEPELADAIRYGIVEATKPFQSQFDEHRPIKTIAATYRVDYPEGHPKR